MGAPNNPKPPEMGEWELLVTQNRGKWENGRITQNRGKWENGSSSYPKTAGNGRMRAPNNPKQREMGEWELLITQNRGKWENGSS